MNFLRGARKSSANRTWGTTSGLQVALLAIILLGASAADIAGELDRVCLFNIESQPLDKALLQFGAQAHVQLSVSLDSAKAGVQTPPLKGRYTGKEALAALLVGTGLRYSVHGLTVEIRQAGQTGGMARRAVPKLAGDIGSDPPASPLPDARESDDQTESHSPPHRVQGVAPALQEVVVTGTHIRGAPPQSTPIIIFTAQEIQDSGYPTLEQFMNSIPQNFGGVGSQSLIGNNTAGNNAYGTGVDLRGLGYETTLVLVDGHRIAPAGMYGAYTDVSVIPLSAIQRIEILPDGASAVYGSDAIGGVVNYILKSDQHGAQTDVEYGSVTSGALKDYRASQSLGEDWSGGDGFLSYEYHDESGLPAADRMYSLAAAPQDLLPELKQDSVFGTIRQTLTDDLGIRSDVFFTDRQNAATAGQLPFVTANEAETRQYQIAAESDWHAPGSWYVSMRTSYGENKTENSFTGAEFGSNAGDSRQALASIDANGTLGRTTAGSILTAVGAQVENERLLQAFVGGDTFPIDKSRTDDALYAELRIPLLRAVQIANSAPRPALELDLASRYEHYTDFGSSENPEVGLAWRPTGAVKFRSTWSSSFAAPPLSSLYGTTYTDLLNSPDPLSSTGTSGFLLLTGSNPNLKPEKSSQWTAGFDFAPLAAQWMDLALSYYDIHFTNRIAPPGFPVFTALDQGDLYAPFITRDPSASLVSQLTSPPYVYDNATVLPFPGYGPPRTLADVVAVANDTYQNIASTETDGADMTANVNAAQGPWRYNIALDATYVFEYRETQGPGSASVSPLSTLGNPLNFRGRVIFGMSRGPLGGDIAMNYDNHYKDASVPSSLVPVASWTTVDVQARYQVPRLPSSPLAHAGLAIALSCVNCLNRPPPFVVPTDSYEGVGYDAANANPLGRFVSLSIEVKW